ncbi:MAG: type II secretion system F family protein, partial [candidate division Zixibacteria bacterium]|nr:type II secretion system F family protein [candidate division Zixibacteria bacterium]
YPIMVIVAMVLASTVILKFVVPRFLDFYTHFGSKLPFPTRLLMAVAGVIGRFWWVLPIGSVGIGLWWWRWTKTPPGEHWRDRMILRLPLVGILFLKVSVSRFARLFGVLFSAGVPATSALDTVRLGVGNVIVAEEIDAMRHRLTTGGSVSLRPVDAVMPELVYQMLGIGFESGDVERMMSEVARHYEQEISYDVRRLTDRLQPILLAMLASGVLLLALSVLLPMWNLISLFRQ